jgi:hypothetical protein
LAAEHGDSQGRRDRSRPQRRHQRGRRQAGATLETGAVVRVPLFVQKGEAIKVNTRTGEYISRA